MRPPAPRSPSSLRVEGRHETSVDRTPRLCHLTCSCLGRSGWASLHPLARLALAVAALALTAGPLTARTITLTGADCTQMAVISEKAPRLSWASILMGQGAYDASHSVQLLGRSMALLIRFPLDQIPKGQRITRAELTVEPNYVAGDCRLQVRRLLADWGHGVCHQYARTYPKKLEWAQPGGRGGARDRADRDSALIKFSAIGKYRTDVTEDIDLWYTGAVANRGWIMVMDAGLAYFPAPYDPAGDGKSWTLQITFEPK